MRGGEETTACKLGVGYHCAALTTSGQGIETEGSVLRAH